MTCSVDGCSNEAASGGLCWGHIKQRQRGGRVRALERRPKSKLERLYEAALTYADAEDDDAYERAKDNLRKSAIAASTALIAELTREALARLRARGVRLGRPPKVEPGEAVRVLAEARTVREAAARLGVSPRTVRRAVRRAQRAG